MSDRVSVSGPCELRKPHDPHVFFDGVIDNAGNRCMWSCPGQASNCANCDDRKCMSCVLREWHDVCEDDCPECCEEA